MYFGDFPLNAIVRIPFNVLTAAGASITSTGGSVRIYKDSSTTERSSSNGITFLRDFDSETGANVVTIDLSDNSDAGFYAAGHDYIIELHGVTINLLSVNEFIGAFSLQNRYSSLSLAGIASAIWQNATSGDFAVSGSIGKSLFTSGAAPGASGGLFISGSNAATTVNITGNITGNISGSVGSVTGLTASNLDVAITSRMASYTQPTNFLTTTFPSGTIANTTNISAGTITTVTHLTNAPTSGDFTGDMKTSLNNATPAVSVGSGGITSSSFATDAISDATISSAAVTKIQDGLSTYAGADTAGTTSLLTQIGSAGAGLTSLGDTRLAHLNADVSVATTGVTTLLSRITGAVALAGSSPSWYVSPVDFTTSINAIKAKTDTIPSNIATIGSLMSISDEDITTITDGILNGPIDTGVTLDKALEMFVAFCSGKITSSATGGNVTYAYYQRDDSTASFTSTCSQTTGIRAAGGVIY